MTDRKLLQQALDALEFPHDSEWSNKAKAIEALQNALTQPEQRAAWQGNGGAGYNVGGAGVAKPKQEPVAWMLTLPDGTHDRILDGKDCDGYVPLYLAPPRKPWVGLTSEDWENTPDTGKQGCERDAELFDWIEQTLKEKNT
mgnify:CR=1 FL=1|tara:strand:- start:539 stop:964 length:426 start_codon:yes stop_codon:yes gene_type:complete